MRSKTGSSPRPGGRIGRIRFAHNYEDIISVENLLEAWREFVRGKRKKLDVQEFQHALMDNIFALHHAIYRMLYPFFDRAFIADSYSCRRGKGTHKAMDRFRRFAYTVSRNHTRTCWVLKCDIRKFFASIDQSILLDILRRSIADERILALLSEIIGSFCSCSPHRHRFTTTVGNRCQHRGLPLGNLTSQLLVNIYMNEFDQFVKHRLKAKHYVRYADDFVFLSASRSDLDILLPKIAEFLERRLALTLHPDKVFIKTLASGVDFLGWVHFPDHRVLRTATKRRMMSATARSESKPVLESYSGLLSHGNARKLARPILTKLKSLK